MPDMIRNAALIDVRSGELQRRYEPSFHQRTLDSTIKLLPGLRASFLSSEFDTAGALVNTSVGTNLTRQGGPLYSYEYLRPVVILDGVGDYFQVADAAIWDILGTEAYVNPNEQGLTMGIWVKPHTVGANQDIIGKWNAAGNQRSYLITLLNTNVFRADVSANGVAVVSVSSTVTVSADQWYYVEMAYSPSGQQNRLAICVNGVIDDNVVGIPAALFNSTADFTIGGSHGGTNLLTGRFSASWLCAMYHGGPAVDTTDTLMLHVWHQTRALFGV